MISIYNTITNKKEEFTPIEKKSVKMYVCGPTVYNYIHIGNARPLIVFDVVRNYLEYKGYEVNYIQNITDVDDKIINKAIELGESAEAISEKFIAEFFKDFDSLGLRRANLYPKVTENLEDIIEFINLLVEKEMAYFVEGNVYFRTEKFTEYGKLSNQSLKDLKIGSRIDIDEKKENPADFALWKKAKPKEIYWESPWGKGRPGWHIECSALAKKFLGETIDIHGGGVDLIFPHHENEIAQTESLTNKPFAKYWMHNGHLTINDEKMSKSLGNTLTVRELLNEYDSITLKFALLSVHYRSPLNFSELLIEQTVNGIERIKSSYTNLIYRLGNAENELISDEEMLLKVDELYLRFEKEMNDDFNTANSITVVFDAIKMVNIYLNEENVSKKALNSMIELIKVILGVLGLGDLIIEKKAVGNEDQWIEDLIEERNIAKRNKNWIVADDIRNKLKENGVILEDTSQGVRWKRK